jgi:hypothetical protein
MVTFAIILKNRNINIQFHSFVVNRNVPIVCIESFAIAVYAANKKEIYIVNVNY